MHTRRFEPLRQELRRALTLLDGVQESHWTSRIRTALGADDVDPCEVLSWYGGMGSFNDLVIARVNGHRIETGRERTVNDELDQVRKRIYDLAVRLQSR